MKKLLFFLIPIFNYAQEVEIGNWKDYLSYSSATHIAEGEDMIYCVASGGLFHVNKLDNTINRMSKITGLSDINITKVAYSNNLKITVISYENCNIDLLKNNQIINISDIKRAEIIGLKEVNDIIINDDLAYVSCSFGIVVIDLLTCKQ